MAQTTTAGATDSNLNLDMVWMHSTNCSPQLSGLQDKDLIDQYWDSALPEAIPDFISDNGRSRFYFAFQRLHTKINDSKAY